MMIWMKLCKVTDYLAYSTKINNESWKWELTRMWGLVEQYCNIPDRDVSMYHADSQSIDISSISQYKSEL